MNKQTLLTTMALAVAMIVKAQPSTITIHADLGKEIIHKELYGQFAEHLGTCIYSGIWVGTDSEIPNTDGYRNDVLQALKDLHIPVLRWPGGCFADEYHWMDGIGPQDQRPTMQNNNWGGVIEDNSFGTHEFLNPCEMLGCEPYISGNVGSGTVEELAKWVEYMTSDGDTPMARLRRQNGREKPWHVKYLGVGNESWGCGGSMRPEYYSDLYRRYATYCREYDGNRLYKIASGASDYNYNWTRVLMNQVGNRMNGLSLHYYTVANWDAKGSATDFNDDDYYWTLGKCLEIEEVIRKHKEIMDEKDPKRKIGLLVDEWGTWWDQTPGSPDGFLQQQNTMRDAIVAALTLNVFHRHTDRVRMCNIAQMVNVLQAMILTDTNDGGHITLTPTYHVFEMYRPFQDATFLPIDLQCEQLTVRHDPTKAIDANDSHTYRAVPTLSATAARTTDGNLAIALVNTTLDKQQQVEICIEGATAKNLTGRILTCMNIADFNDFSHPHTVEPKEFNGVKIGTGMRGYEGTRKLVVTLPAHSIVVLSAK